MDGQLDKERSRKNNHKNLKALLIFVCQRNTDKPTHAIDRVFKISCNSFNKNKQNCFSIIKEIGIYHNFQALSQIETLKNTLSQNYSDGH